MLVACPNPRSVVIPRDGVLVAVAMRCKSRRCPSCGVLWAGDTRRRLLANITAYGGDVALATITAPGRDQLPDAAAMTAWNQTAPMRWRQLHRACSQAGLRATGTRPNVLAWSWEYQDRGALHKHLPLGVATPGEKHAARVYMNELERLGPGFGFGFVSDTRRGKLARAWRQIGPEAIPAQRAARYVSKYLSPLDRHGKPSMSQTVTHADVPPLVVFVSRKLTTQTGVTMRRLRWERRAFALKIDPDTAETFASITRRETIAMLNPEALAIFEAHRPHP